MSEKDEKYSPSITDESVKGKTGKTWDEWFKIIDKFDLISHGHKATTAHLLRKYNVTPWWSQTITVEYERYHGLREVNQRAGGFAFSVTRTIQTSINDAWNAWSKASEHNKWFTTGAKINFREGGVYSNNDKDRGTIRTIIPHKRIVFTWDNPQHSPGTEVEVRFEVVSDEKIRIVLTHSKLPDKTNVADMRQGWTWALESLKSYLETGVPIRHDEWMKSHSKKSPAE